MTIVQLKFSNEIFDGSLFEGELVKNEDEKWIFLINDVMYYKGKNIVTNDFNQRQEVINDFLENEYEYDPDSTIGDGLDILDLSKEVNKTNPWTIIP